MHLFSNSSLRFICAIVWGVHVPCCSHHHTVDHPWLRRSKFNEQIEGPWHILYSGTIIHFMKVFSSCNSLPVISRITIMFTSSPTLNFCHLLQSALESNLKKKKTKKNGILFNRYDLSPVATLGKNVNLLEFRCIKARCESIFYNDFLGLCRAALRYSFSNVCLSCKYWYKSHTLASLSLLNTCQNGPEVEDVQALITANSIVNVIMIKIVWSGLFLYCTVSVYIVTGSTCYA